MSAPGDTQPLVRATGLHRYFAQRRGVLRRVVGHVRAVDDVSFDIRRGETLGLVGESGSGKTTTGRLVLALDKATQGSVEIDGKNLANLPSPELRQARRHMQFVPQDPFASLNPRLRAGSAIREPLDIHALGKRNERSDRVIELLEQVGLDADHADRYPHQFSGGQRQRIAIARALATSPDFIVADEPISALDVSIQAQIVNLLADLKERLGLTYLFIAHDLSMVRHLSDRVAVMYLGRLVEIGPAEQVFGHARHPYTRALIGAIPRRSIVADPQRMATDEPPDPAAPPPGCRFHTRCPFADSLCKREVPPLRPVGGSVAAHEVACHHAESISATNSEDPGIP